MLAHVANWRRPTTQDMLSLLSWKPPWSGLKEKYIENVVEAVSVTEWDLCSCSETSELVSECVLKLWCGFPLPMQTWPTERHPRGRRSRLRQKPEDRRLTAWWGQRLKVKDVSLVLMSPHTGPKLISAHQKVLLYFLLKNLSLSDSVRKLFTFTTMSRTEMLLHNMSRASRHVTKCCFTKFHVLNTNCQMARHVAWGHRLSCHRKSPHVMTRVTECLVTKCHITSCRDTEHHKTSCDITPDLCSSSFTTVEINQSWVTCSYRNCSFLIFRSTRV